MQKRKGNPDFFLFFLTISLVLFGVIMIFSASSFDAVHYKKDVLYYVKRQTVFAIIGFALLLITMNLDFRKWSKLWVPFFILTIFLLMLVLVVGNKVNGARSWLQIGSFTLQPSEFSKLTIILYLSVLLSRKQELLNDFRKGFLPVLIVVCFFSGLIMLQPDLGSTLVFLLISSVLIFISGVNLKHIFIVASFIFLVGVIYVLYKVNVHHDYRSSRLTSFIDPWIDSEGSGFQLIQSLYALGHGATQGTGLGGGFQKYRIPEAYNDFIFPVIGEELGFVGCAALIFAYTVFIWRGIVISLQSPEVLGKLLGIGVVSMIAFQVFINIGGVTGVIPLTGITLPFISYGGSSLLTTLFSVGILLNISRQKEDKENKSIKS